MDLLLSGQLFFAALMLASIYALVALGLNLIYGTMRLLNIAHGEIVMLGGYVTYWSVTMLGVDPLLSIFLSMLFTAGLGAVSYLLLVRKLLRSTTLLARIEANSLLLFFGLSVILQNVAALVFTANERSYPYGNEIISFGDVSLTLSRFIVLAVALVATLGCIAFFRFNLIGMAIRALIQQRDAAALVGINIDRTNLVVFCLGFAMAGLAGTLISMTEQISPYMGFPFTIAAFVVIILGGLGNLYGGLLGAAVLAIVEVYGVAMTSSAYRSILVYGIFIAILLIRPEGLLAPRKYR
jgi:branched-chain amino acid transport system permease protein